MNKQTQTTFPALRAIAQSIQTGTNTQTLALIDALIIQKKAEQKPAWVRELGKLATFIKGGAYAPWAIFKLDGNSKLPFAAFSSLPGVTCPGAGDCLNWCYSFRAWRYPAAFCRMAQNAHLMRTNTEIVAEAFRALPRTVKTVRLYVDGDFANVRDVSFWMSEITMQSHIDVYGYSKSFKELLAYAGLGLGFPKNYLLNLSGGHNHNAETLAKMQALPITRGTFNAVSIGRKVKSTDHGKPSTNKALWQAAGKGVFPCPGKCGTCTPKGHACGSERFRSIPIVIAVH